MLTTEVGGEGGFSLVALMKLKTYQADCRKLNPLLEVWNDQAGVMRLPPVSSGQPDTCLVLGRAACGELVFKKEP